MSLSIARLQAGNVSALKSVGRGVSELRIDYGPGYRVYVGREGSNVVILLAGGTKKRQSQDISQAHALWAEYKQSKGRTHAEKLVAI